MPNRIAILGSPGAGKSTLARTLAIKYNLPIVHLDYYYHNSDYDYLNDLESWVKKANSFTKADQWIIEGNYLSSITDRLSNADTIILIDLPRWKNLIRVFKRRIEYRDKRREEMPANWKEKLDPIFIKFVWDFKNNQLMQIKEEFNKYPDKNILVFKNTKQINEFLTKN